MTLGHALGRNKKARLNDWENRRNLLTMVKQRDGKWESPQVYTR